MASAKYLNDRAINCRQGGEIGDRHALVDGMHGLADQAEFHHRAILRDEARIGCTAAGGEFRLAAGGLGTASATRSVNGPGLTANTPAFDGSHLNANFIFPPAALAARRSIRALSESSVCLSLKRILKRARASPGIRLTVLLPTSTEVNSRCEGRKQRAAFVERLGLQGPTRSSTSPRIGLSARSGIGDMALLAGDH